MIKAYAFNVSLLARYYHSSLAPINKRVRRLEYFREQSSKRHVTPKVFNVILACLSRPVTTPTRTEFPLTASGKDLPFYSSTICYNRL